MSDKNVALKGGFWTSVSTGVVMLAQFGRVVILTRFLEKSDFGAVAIINMVIGLCLSFTDLGFASVIMYKQKLTLREFSSLYWAQFAIFLVLYIMLSLSSPLVASFYETPILAALIPLSGLSVIFQALGKLYDSVLQKKYQFKELAMRNIVANLLSLVLAWFLAYNGYGIYSLVYSTLCSIVVVNVWNLLSGFKYQRISMTFSMKEVVPLAKIGIYQTGTRIIDFIASKIDVFIIGKFLGTDVLGVYDLAKDLVHRIINFVNTVVSKVALPILSNNNNDDEAVKVRFLMITKVVAYICIPICLAIAVFSKDVVWIVYGEKFLDASFMVSIFAIGSMFGSITCFYDMLGIAKGRTDLNFKATIFRVCLIIPITLICCQFSIDILVVCNFLFGLILIPIYWRLIVMNTYPISARLYMGQFGKYMLLVGVAAIITRILLEMNIFGTFGNNVLHLFVYSAIFVFLYMIALIPVKNDVEIICKMIRPKR
ncbi:lipopolysaccharide biosynthesis protein [uncultured Prevotella sp.]|uniref:lipopolysaccharide biosynthesis protein n=1 Tax=uncultured Prevotella sp. TaxID=159272 RepID=UPI0025DE056E|nr:lipopolysaccharide biosynthesis protein [uncultured Prevotella sp.]